MDAIWTSSLPCSLIKMRAGETAGVVNDSSAQLVEISDDWTYRVNLSTKIANSHEIMNQLYDFTMLLAEDMSWV